MVVPVPQQITELYGGIWHGRATLVNGYSLEWQVRARSLWVLRGVVDWSVQGSDTQLSGIATVTPWSLRGSDIVGRAGPGLLDFVPDAMLTDCSARAVVDVQNVVAKQGSFAAAGVVSADAGTCKDLLGRVISLPAMTLDLSTIGDDARGDLRDRDGRLAQVTVTGNRRVIVRVEPEGAALIPGMPTGGPIVIEYPF